MFDMPFWHSVDHRNLSVIKIAVFNRCETTDELESISFVAFLRQKDGKSILSALGAGKAVRASIFGSFQAEGQRQ